MCGIAAWFIGIGIFGCIIGGTAAFVLVPIAVFGFVVTCALAGS